MKIPMAQHLDWGSHAPDKEHSFYKGHPFRNLEILLKRMKSDNRTLLSQYLHYAESRAKQGAWHVVHQLCQGVGPCESRPI